MRINQFIWTFFFLTSAIVMALFTLALHTWAYNIAIPGTEMYCRGTLVADIPLSRAPLCVAIWVAEAKTWMVYARDILLEGPIDLQVGQLLRTADVMLYVIGLFAFGVALASLTATAMTSLMMSTFAGSYTLMHGIYSFLGGRRVA